jgi:hypothetical protein
MKVLVACEESQAVCKAFREKGHEAYSCDIIDCSGGHPEWHIQGDVLKILNPKDHYSKMGKSIMFRTCDGIHHEIIGKWDLIIAHPPCTRLCTTSQRWLYFGDNEYRAKKIQEQQKAIVFFMMFALADCERIAIENPQGIMSTAFRKPDCIYNPYDFEGETECKKTCLWLKGLPPLKPTRAVPLPKEQRTRGIFKSHFDGKIIGWNNPECAKMRSKTPAGVARAMAEQWG